MNFVQKIVKHFADRKAAKSAADFQAKVHSPTLFSDKQRAYLVALFPDGWCHLDNMPQEDVFKIALTMTMFGYQCNTLDTMKFCMYVLRAQKIYRVAPGSTSVIKRA